MSPPCRVLIFQKLPYPRVRVRVVSMSVSVSVQLRSFLMITNSPFPILHLAPNLTTCLPFRIPCQAYNPFIFTSSSKIEQFGKYFDLKTLYSKESMLCRSLHTCCPYKGNLYFTISLKPKPPLFFGKHRFFHATQCIFLASLLYPHQNFQIRASISLHKDFGSKKQPMVGMAWSTTLIKISLPPCESSFSFHPWILCQICSLYQKSKKAEELSESNESRSPSCCKAEAKINDK